MKNEAKLIPAYFYKDELQKIYAQEIYKEKYKFASSSCYQELILKIEENSWLKEQYVILLDDRIIGYCSASINRETDSISNLFILNFSNEVESFAAGLTHFFNLFLDRFNKINFSVIIGNTTEKFYDKLLDIPEFHGRIIGVFKNEVKLMDNKLYDLKWYEFSKKEI
jgi:hypothetical protein